MTRNVGKRRTCRDGAPAAMVREHGGRARRASSVMVLGVGAFAHSTTQILADAGASVFLLEAPGLDGKGPLTSVAALANEFAQAIRDVAPLGPVRLLGWSFAQSVLAAAWEVEDSLDATPWIAVARAFDSLRGA